MFLLISQAERKFLDAQDIRRQMQLELSELQLRVTTLRGELEKVKRGEEKYFTLMKEEIDTLKEEEKMMNELKHKEELERTYFTSLQSAFRESHEKERSRTERTKYWSITGSIIGVMLGACGTSLNNYLRMRELKRMVREQGKEGGETKALLGKLIDRVATEQNTMKAFVFDVKGAMGLGVDESKQPSVEMRDDPLKSLEVISQNYQTLQSDMKDVKDVLQKAKVFDKDDNVIYVGSEIKDALATTEKNIESEIKDALETTENNIEAKMKLNALYTVTFIYGALALAVPVIVGLIKGS